MRSQSILLAISSCFVVCSSFLLLLSRTVKGGGPEEFNYDPNSERGPKHWGDLKREWAKCNDGKIQSPIPLSKRNAQLNRALLGGDLNRNHRPADAILKSHPHELVVDWVGANAGSVTIDNIDYRLENFHWHHPSEHTQDHKTFPLELHMVHMNNNTNVIPNIAVISIPFEYGPRDPFISLIESDMQHLKIGGEKILGEVDPNVARLDGRKYFRYIGSLTTPPCTEGVLWTVMEKVQTVSPYQVELIKQIVVEENNARPLQEINGRDVFYYDPF